MDSSFIHSFIYSIIVFGTFYVINQRLSVGGRESGTTREMFNGIGKKMKKNEKNIKGKINFQKDEKFIHHSQKNCFIYFLFLLFLIFQFKNFPKQNSLYTWISFSEKHFSLLMKFSVLNYIFIFLSFLLLLFHLIFLFFYWNDFFDSSTSWWKVCPDIIMYFF